MIFSKWNKVKRKLSYEWNDISRCLSDCVESVNKDEYHKIRQLVHRFNSNERTNELYTDIMSL